MVTHMVGNIQTSSHAPTSNVLGQPYENNEEILDINHKKVVCFGGQNLHYTNSKGKGKTERARGNGGRWTNARFQQSKLNLFLVETPNLVKGTVEVFILIAKW